MFKTFLALTLVLFGVTACNSGINKELALKYGIDPEKPIKEEGGGCIPELIGKKFDMPDGAYGEFISGGKECRATKVIDSPQLLPDETADIEFVAMPGDDFPAGRPKGARDFEHAFRKALENNPDFKNDKVRIRIVSRLGHTIEGLGQTTIEGGMPSDSLGAYTLNAGLSFSGLLDELSRKQSAKSFSVYGFSGGGTTILNGLSMNNHDRVLRVTTIESWCDLGLIASQTGKTFTNMRNPKHTLKDINPKISMNFILGSGGDYLSKLGSQSCVDELKKYGRNVSMLEVQASSHLNALKAETLTLPQNSIYDSIAYVR